MIDILHAALFTYFAFSVVYFIAINLVYTVLLLISYREVQYYMRHNSFSDYRVMVQSELVPPVSILAPAYNEEATVVESVKSLLKLSYGKYEVVVINDGSRDNTLKELVDEFDLFASKKLHQEMIRAKKVRGIYKSGLPQYRNLIVVDKENGGKADALNVGINVSQYEYVCAIDADSLLEDDALMKVMKPFMEDARVIATGGIVRIVNGCEVVNGRVVRVGLSRKFLPVFQVIEYFRAFLSGRMAWHGLNGLLIISGAFGMFKKSAAIEAGGYYPATVGEDMELVVRMHRTKLEKREEYRVAFVPDPVCWTEAPESLNGLGKQRNRWHRGLLDTLSIHSDMLLNRRYGVVGMAAMPYFFFVELLGPAVEFFGYVVVVLLLLFGQFNLDMLVLFFIVAVLYGVMFSVGAVLLEEVSFRRYPKPGDLLLLLFIGVVENFGYRQLTAWWRVKGFIDYYRGKEGWGTIQRKGFGPSTSGSQHAKR
ncbi:MAG: glycosyltransferase family 2 protein [Ignavibacteria bacterium]|nr:glycosyltransferase family 2 protein [Ignavibacteria bacterium]